MAEAPKIEGYEIIVTPEGKFTLRWDNGQAGPFGSQLEAETAMGRVIKKEVYRYDAKGKLLTEARKENL